MTLAALNPGRPCTECGGAWWGLHDIRGRLAWAHTPGCTIDRAEIATQLADHQRGGAFTRRATPLERELLRSLGYTVVDGGEWEDEEPGQLVDVTWISHIIRRRVFRPANAPKGSGLPEDPLLQVVTTPPLPVRERHPITWWYGAEPAATTRKTRRPDPPPEPTNHQHGALPQPTVGTQPAPTEPTPAEQGGGRGETPTPPGPWARQLRCAEGSNVQRRHDEGPQDAPGGPRRSPSMRGVSVDSGGCGQSR